MTTPTTRPATVTRDKLCPFRGLGTSVDVYDTESAFSDSGTPPIHADDITRMRADGVHTLYIQVAKDDPRSPGIITNPKNAAAFLTRAHANGMKVVAWYLPTHRDPALDQRRAIALANFTAGGQRFDGIALDIEGIDVKDVALRNSRLVSLVKALDGAAGDRPIGAIVYPPVATDVLNPSLWPEFPWKALAPHIDVWLPMAYWTFRSHQSIYRDPYRYTTENVQRIRTHLGDAAAAVHVIGGIADTSSNADDIAFERGARTSHAIGTSLYDYNTMRKDAWPALRSLPEC